MVPKTKKKKKPTPPHRHGCTEDIGGGQSQKKKKGCSEAIFLTHSVQMDKCMFGVTPKEMVQA